MLITACLIGIGAYILFRDLPEDARKTSIKHSWLPHIGIFTLLFFLHGGSAEGAAMAGVATLIFRWLMPMAAPREKKERSPDKSRFSIREHTYSSEDALDFFGPLIVFFISIFVWATVWKML